MMIMSYDGVHLFSSGEILHLTNDTRRTLHTRLDSVQSAILFFVHILGMARAWDPVNMERYCRYNELEYFFILGSRPRAPPSR